MTYLLVAAGGALGSMARYGLAEWLDGDHHGALPWGTFGVNLLGSLAIGLIAGWGMASQRLGLGLGLSDEARLFLMVGFCGGFTTFSSFSLQVFALLRDGFLLRAGGYALASMLLCVIATSLGWLLAQGLTSRA